MKIINKRYYHDFDCVISGKIQITPEELKRIVKLLNKWKIDTSYSYIKPRAIERLQDIFTTGCCCLGVTATEYILSKFKLDKSRYSYKQLNYMFELL